MLKTLVPFCILFAATLSACKKPIKENKNPISEITCVVNGVDWKASYNENIFISRYGDVGPKAGYYEDNYTLTLFGVEAKGTDTTVLRMEVNKKPGVKGIYTIQYVNDPEVFALFYANLDDYENEKVDIYEGGSGTGTLEITSYDSTKGIIDGVFNFELKPNAMNSSRPTFNITQGKIIGLRRYD